MIILLIHASEFSFSMKEKAIKNPEEPKLESLKKDNVLVAFTTVEKGDDDEIIKRAVKEILDIYDKVKASAIVVYPYAHLSDNLESPSIAIRILEKLEKNISTENVEVYRAPFGWYKQFMVNCYGHPLSELSKRIRHEIEYEKSNELGVCEKFGFPSSPYAMFMKNSVLEYVKFLSKSYTIVGDEEPHEGEFSIRYVESQGRKLPCVNEPTRILVKVKGDVKEIPEEFSDSKNKYLVKVLEGDFSKIDINLLTYYYILEAQKVSPPTLPLWLSPIQIRLLPLKQFLNDATEIAKKIKGRVDIDDLPDSLGAKIARAGKDWVPFVAIIGEREVKTQTLTVKVRVKNEQRSFTIDEINEEIEKGDPLKLSSNFPLLLSKRDKRYLVTS